MSGVGKGNYKFDYKWLGYRVEAARVVMEFELKGKAPGSLWRIEESLEIPSLLQQRVHFSINILQRQTRC